MGRGAVPSALTGHHLHCHEQTDILLAAAAAAALVLKRFVSCWPTCVGLAVSSTLEDGWLLVCGLRASL